MKYEWVDNAAELYYVDNGSSLVLATIHVSTPGYISRGVYYWDGCTYLDLQKLKSIIETKFENGYRT